MPTMDSLVEAFLIVYLLHQIFHHFSQSPMPNLGADAAALLSYAVLVYGVAYWIQNHRQPPRPAATELEWGEKDNVTWGTM